MKRNEDGGIWTIIWWKTVMYSSKVLSEFVGVLCMEGSKVITFGATQVAETF